MTRTLVLLAVGLLAACGWRAGLPRPVGAQTLAVAFPGNDSRLRDLEVDLGQALAEAALDRLSLRLVAPAEADLVIQGRIYDFRRLGGIRAPDNELVEAQDLIGVELALVETATGNELGTVSRRLWAGFAVDIDEAATNAADERETQLRVARNLAEGLILELFDPLTYETGSSQRRPTSE
ncbi:MAG: hypothetical protein AAFZ65_15220 [Planctomycetota bacterium]